MSTKLIYEKTSKNLYGSEMDIPTKDDKPVIYKDANGADINNITEYTYFYNKDGSVYAGKSKNQVADEENDILVIPYVNDEPVIGKMLTITSNKAEVENTTGTPECPDYAMQNSNVKIKIVASEGYVATATANGEKVTLNSSGEGTFKIVADTTVEFTVTAE